MKRTVFLGLCMMLVKSELAQTTTLANGCNIIEADSDLHGGPIELKAPYLNCTHRKLLNFDFSGVPADIVSISLAYNELTTFELDKIANFTKLKLLNLGHNKISTVVPLTNKTMPSVMRVYIGNNKLGRIPTELWNSFPALQDAEIGGNQIAAINDGDFENAVKLSTLSLAFNPLKTISGTAMQIVSPNLFHLDLSFCGLTDVPEFLANLPKVHILALTGNEITHVSKNAFQGAKSLQSLVLSSNKIRSLDSLAFAGAEKLRFLDLTNNLLETLPAGVFDAMNAEMPVVGIFENPLRCDCSLSWLKEWETSIKFSDVGYKCAQPSRNHGKTSYNLNVADFSCKLDDEDWSEGCSANGGKQTTQVPTQAATDASESSLCPKKCKCFNSKAVHEDAKIGAADETVKYPFVDCSDAGLTKLPADIRSDVKTLSLEGNNILTINIMDLKPFQSLEFLNLESCTIKTIKPDLTTTFESLTTLYVNHNNLTKFGKDHLKSFPNLKVLQMHDNKVQNFSKDIFSNNRALVSLFIGPNPAKMFDLKCLDGLKLVFLSLRNLSLTSIPEVKSVHLSHLELSDNKITVVPNNTFAFTPKLFRLALDNNKITTIAPLAFRKASSLRILELSQNKITTLPRGVFDDLNKERLQIQLWRNRMNCDCNLKWLRQWIDGLEMENPMTEIRFMCFRPFRMHGKMADKLAPNDFICEDGDEMSRPGESDKVAEEEYYTYEHGNCFTGGHIALTVFLSIFFTLLCLALLQWFRARRRGYARYKSPNETVQLDLNDESA